MTTPYDGHLALWHWMGKAVPEDTIAEVITANPQAIADFKGGKAQSLTFLIGQVMKATRGRANPKLVDEILKNKLERED